MAKAKKDIPTYVSPFKEIDVAKDIFAFTIEVKNPEDEEEVEKYTELKYVILTKTQSSYSESTLKRASSLHEKLFLCENEEDVIKTVNGAVNMSFTQEFKPRAFADVLRSKIGLITNEDYKRLLNYTIESLENHLCITTVVKSMFGILGKAQSPREEN